MTDIFLYIAGFSCTFAVLAYLIKIIRVFKKVQVNCWFCNKNTKVEYKFSNSFICPFCEQYNGFKEDGDYNCVITEQLCNPFTHHSAQPPRKLLKDKSKFDNGFCEACNLNQALKIRALAEFSSVSSDDNDEVEKFRERLEEIYGLCQCCQATVNQALGKQNSWLKPLLISWRLMKSKENALKIISLKTKESSITKIFHIFSLLICIILCLLSVEKYSEILKPYKQDYALKLTNIGISSLSLVWTGISVHGFTALFFQTSLFKITNVLSFLGWLLLLLVETEADFFSESRTPHLKFILSFINFVFNIWITTKMFRASTYNLNSSAKKSDHTSILSNSYSDLINESSGSSVPNNSFVTTPDCTVEHIRAKKEIDQEDLDADLLSLKISTPKKNCNSNFSPQNLFRGSSSSCKGSVLQPSKFGKHCITQSSWVAGGYWGSPGSPQRGRLTRHNVSHLEEFKPKPVFSLSRSSSQSSGFVSQYSDCASSRSHHNLFQNLPPRTNSHQSSLTGDAVERGSVYSFGRGINNGTATFGSLRHQNTESYEAQSACSVSSYYSDNSQLHCRPSTRSGSCFPDSGHTSLTADISPDKMDILSCKSNSSSRSNNNNNNNITNSFPSYFNLGIAFILGLSVSANLFLMLVLWHYGVIVK